MFKILHKLILKKFVLLINDDGALLTLFIRSKPVTSLKVEGVHDQNLAALSSLLNKYSKVPIYILADTSEQNLNLLEIPSANKSVAKKLILRKIAKGFNKDDLHNYYPLQSKKSQKKGKSSYLTIAIANISTLSDWLKYLKSFSNYIMGVYSLPIELKHLKTYLDNHYECLDSTHKNKKHDKVKDKKNLKINRWTMLVVQNTIGGVRIIVSYDNDVLFTRMLTFDQASIDEYQLDVLRTQISGTLEYLRRIGFKDKDGIKIFFLCKDNFYKKIDIAKSLRYEVVKVLSKDLNQILYQDKKIVAKDNSLEQNISSFFVKKGVYLGFYTPETKKITNINNFNYSLSFFSILFALGISIYIIFHLQSLRLVTREIVELESKSSKLVQELDSIRKEKFGSDLNEDEVINLANLHRLLIAKKHSPVDMILTLADIKPTNVIIKKISWKQNKQNVVLDVDAMFGSQGLSYEEVFITYDNFIKKLKTNFVQYKISHSELPDTINFDLSLSDIAITFKIEGKVVIKNE